MHAHTDASHSGHHPCDARAGAHAGRRSRQRPPLLHKTTEEKEETRSSTCAGAEEARLPAVEDPVCRAVDQGACERGCGAAGRTFEERAKGVEEGVQ
eukprot:3490375-Rhodomonas_salina.1